MMLEVNSIEPAVLNREGAAKFLGVSKAQLSEFEQLPYWPPDTRFYLNVPKAVKSKREERHYTVAGLRKFIQNAIEESRKIMRAPTIR